MQHWYMLTLVGEDRPGIVAKVTAALFETGANLGEASMMRLGSSFTIMLMAQSEASGRQLEQAIAPVAESLGLDLHVRHLKDGLHQHREPDVRITVFGADRAGIVAQVTGALAEAGLNILDLESDVGGTDEKPFYILHIEGTAAEGFEALESALDAVRELGDVEVRIQPIETLIG